MAARKFYSGHEIIPVDIRDHFVELTIKSFVIAKATTLLNLPDSEKDIIQMKRLGVRTEVCNGSFQTI